MIFTDLKEKARQLPETPGVYIMRDGYGNIIYVGKAKSLKNRVSQYFQSAKRHAPKILKMIELIREFDTIHADTEFEALLLECRLIKDLKPMFNSQLKNHRKYIYIWIDIEAQYPTLEMVDEKQEQGLSFGPYTSSGSVDRAINVIKESLGIRHCSSFASKSSGCLNHQLGICVAPCTGQVSDVEYRQLINQAIGFLKEGKPDLMKSLEEKMHAAAEILDFDKAARYRDDKRALGHLASKQRTIDFTGNSKVFVALEKICGEDSKLFIIKGNRVIYKERVSISQDRNALQEHIVQLVSLYREELVKNENREIDKAEIDQAQIVYSYLQSKKDGCYMRVAKSWLSSKGVDKLQQAALKLINTIST